MELEKSLEVVRERIARAAKLSGRNPEEVRLLAISKFVSLEMMEQAYRLGVHSFGESYVQEAKPKFHAFKDRIPGVDLQFVGRLQRNKVKRAVGMFSLIQSLDRAELVADLAQVAKTLSIRQPVLIQVNVSGEASKGGVEINAVRDLVQLVLESDSLELQGLMSLGSPLLSVGTGNITCKCNKEIQVRREFSSLRELLDSLRQEFSIPLPILSMGTSEDLELAIEEGATLVRVGSALFGERL